MDPALAYMNERLPAMIDWIRGLVKIESPSRDREAVNRAVEYVADYVSGFADIQRFPQAELGDHLRIEFRLPRATKDRQVLGLGHLDTVYQHGTLARMPFKREEGRLWGPGVFDMKSGVAYLIFAAEALRDLDLGPHRRFVVQLNSDEEIGSPSSRPLTEREAQASEAVLVTEGSVGLDGRVKTGRKGGGTFVISAHGKASHSGLDFEAGASAVVEIARQIERVAGWTDLEAGVTVNPGVIHGGTVSNVVAENAYTEVDVRVPKLGQAGRLEGRFQAIQAFDPRVEVTVEGGLRRPPMERTADVERLYRLAQRLAGELGVELGEAQVGGGSDGNFTAAIGTPTLDGLGSVGEGAHASHESILVDRMADRAALIAKLVAAL